MCGWVLLRTGSPAGSLTVLRGGFAHRAVLGVLRSRAVGMVTLNPKP